MLLYSLAEPDLYDSRVWLRGELLTELAIGNICPLVKLTLVLYFIQ